MNVGCDGVNDEYFARASGAARGGRKVNEQRQHFICGRGRGRNGQDNGQLSG